jgi:serine/threonine protein kinase
VSVDAGERASAHVRVLGIEPGDVLADKYEVERVLGSGGMGVVVAARHIHLDERVAIKFLRPEALSNYEAVARFNQEARVAVKIKSEHVARVIDVGQLANGAPYLVMEYLEGIDLSQWLRDYGPLEVSQAVEFIIHACEALAEAHAAGIVHRDLKPANLFAVRDADGLLSVKVLDFGISKLSAMGSMSAPSMTNTHAILGSPQYMSPEQLQSSKTVDSRTDIWSLGIILYELLAGYAPFNAETMPELVLAIVRDPLFTVNQARPGLPVGVDRAVSRALEKDRAVRYQTVADLAVALQEFAPPAAHPIVERCVRIVETSGTRVGRTSMLSIPPLSVPPVPYDPSNDLTERNAMAGTISNWGQTDTAQRAQRRRRRTRRAMILAALGGSMLTGLGAFGWQYRERRIEAEELEARSAAQASALAQAQHVRPPASVVPPAASDGGAGTNPDLGPDAALPTVELDDIDAGSNLLVVPIHPPVTSASASAGGKKVAPPPTVKHHQGGGTAGKEATPPAASCTPPYVIDADGHKQYKPECI